MKVAKKPETDPGRPADWTPPSYVRMLCHEAASAAKNAKRVQEATHLQRCCERQAREDFRNNRR